MNNQQHNTDSVRDKILKGVDLAFKKMLKVKKKNDGRIAIVRDGKIVNIRAKDF